MELMKYEGEKKENKFDSKWALTGSVCCNVITAGCSNCDWCIIKNLLLLFGSMLVQSAVLCSVFCSSAKYSFVHSNQM